MQEAINESLTLISQALELLIEIQKQADTKAVDEAMYKLNQAVDKLTQSGGST